MITLVQKVVRYAVGSSQSDVVQDASNSRPNLEDFVSTSHSIPEAKAFEGLVTSIDPSCIVIDQDVYCEPSEFPLNKMCLGVKVKGRAQRGGKHEMWRAKTIEVVDEEWDVRFHHSGKNYDGNEIKSIFANDCDAVPCKDLAEGIPGIYKSDLLSSEVSSRSPQRGCMFEGRPVSAKTEASKTIIGKVTGIYGDTVTLNDSICCKMTFSSSTMDLVAGDWIVFDVADGSSCADDGEAGEQHGIILISSFKPLRKKKVRGEVTHSYQKHLIINGEVFCSRAIAGATHAKTGDAVTAEVIESQQGYLCWRAIFVASDYIASSTQEVALPLSVVQLRHRPKVDVEKNKSLSILEDKEDIRITQAIRFPKVTFGTASFMDVSIKNIGQRPRTLQKVYFVYASQESQLSVSWCSGGGTVDGGGGAVTLVQPGAEAVVRLCCAATLIGSFRQLCLFEFDNFHISRYVSVTVEDPLMASLAPVSSYTHRPLRHSLTVPSEREVILGQKSFKPSPFTPVKLPGARVPESLWHEVNRGDLFNVMTVLREPLNAENHQKKFSLLLHLEEIKMIQQMREYDMARASFTVCGEFLSLSVPGLAEKRPSLMLGDTVIATELCGPEMEYEGCIHQVLNTQILLKFHSSFHTSYHGEDYKVRFNFNRTPLRRCHFALSYAMKQLGQDVLFPFRLKFQLPQVCYVDPEMEEVKKRWKCSSSNSHQVKGKTDQSLRGFKSNLQEISSKQESANSLSEMKVYKVDIPSSDLVPQSQDLAVSTRTNGTKVSNTRNVIYENGEKNSTSKITSRNKFGCDGAGAHSAVDNNNTPTYVIPVLPFCHLRKKTQNLENFPVLMWFNKSLNQEQKLAVRKILEGTSRPLPYIIFGPPGTGKTVTVVEAALQILTLMHHSRLLLVTPSNSASDLVAERMIESGQLGISDLVRLIAYQRSQESIPKVIQPYCCTGEELEVRAHQRVVVATATCAGVLYLQGLHQEHFTHVLVDEAGQLTEPECLLAMGLVNRVTGQTVLAGDPKQLGPVIQSALAKRGGLQQSLLQRLCQTVLYQAQERRESNTWVYDPCLVTQLVKNYRSHPHILAVPSHLFYNNTLQACANIKALDHLLSWKELPCSSCPLLFHGVVGTNLREGDSPSWFNPAEAFQVVRYTKSLLSHGVEERNIGIISPYRKQIEKLHKLLSTFGIEGIKVGSVEEFQGQEMRVILISTVRSSICWLEEDAKYSLGFIQCCKRFNVAVTRAQGLLVIVGNPVLLSRDNSWKHMIQFCIEQGSYRGPELQDLLRNTL